MAGLVLRVLHSFALACLLDLEYILLIICLYFIFEVLIYENEVFLHFIQELALLQWELCALHG
jgi:hypothetical protein